ncbi:hypothetical protein [Actinoplanes subglobosus]|uniref:Uncharacterized protein n=1 Tax=Actinoplanes subglobosus TaxID=1547892 RepID=A0ABV8JAF7_9ACTN
MIPVAAGPCHPDFTALADALGGIECAAANPVVTVRDPGELQSWTQPVLELLMVTGAVAALIHAVLWWRRHGDPGNLGLWLATVVYVLILEPPLYFPDRFGLDEQVGLIFVHNVFTVQFLFDRLPLYIVALYPAMTYLAYALVQQAGILDRRSPLVGAACVAVVFHVGYEIFDQIGPDLRWWVWNPAAPSNAPMLGDAPLTSAVIFAAAAPFGTVLLTRLLLAGRPLRAWRVAAVGVLTPLAMMAFSIPTLPFGPSGRTVVLWCELAALAVVAIMAVTRQGEGVAALSPKAWPGRKRERSPQGRPEGRSQGRPEGRSQGRPEGRPQGRPEGRPEEGSEEGPSGGLGEGLTGNPAERTALGAATVYLAVMLLLWTAGSGPPMAIVYALGWAAILLALSRRTLADIGQRL